MYCLSVLICGLLSAGWFSAGRLVAVMWSLNDNSLSEMVIVVRSCLSVDYGLSVWLLQCWSWSVATATVEGQCRCRVLLHSDSELIVLSSWFLNIGYCVYICVGVCVCVCVWQLDFYSQNVGDVNSERCRRARTSVVCCQCWVRFLCCCVLCACVVCDWVCYLVG